MSYLIKEKMMRDKSNQDDTVTFGDSAVAAVENASAKKEGRTEAPFFGAKKEKVEVAGYHYLPGVVANQTLNIDKLPNEMLEKIFENLIELENGKGESYITCRLVSTRWKFWMESVLEKKSISIWKAVPISIKNLEAEPPALVHLFVLNTENRFTPVKWAFLPPALESWEEKGTPFPSQSLKLASHAEDCDRFHRSRKPRRRAQLIRLTDFFSKFGEHLTSLILTSVTLTPETFIGILENTPKLKALNLFRVIFRWRLENCAQLPALQHLRVFHVKITLKKRDALDFSYNNDKKIKLYNWIVSPFQQQLLTLDIDGQSGILTAANFANLERGVEIRFNRHVAIMEWFKQHIDPLAETLSEFHLDIPRYGFEQLLVTGPLFQLSPKSTQNETNEVVFRVLKTFVITFPYYPEEVEVIKTLIKGFPNLEALTFIDRTCRVGDYENVVDREEYAKVCPTLKKIRIRRF